ICTSSGARGDSICCETTIGTGTYWLIVATTDFFNVPCGARYVISVTQDSCPQPFRAECPLGATKELEPTCSDFYVDATNGGCNSTPPVFTPLHYSTRRPTQVCGTYGAYRYQGVDY